MESKRTKFKSKHLGSICTFLRCMPTVEYDQKREKEAKAP